MQFMNKALLQDPVLKTKLFVCEFLWSTRSVGLFLLCELYRQK